VLGGRHVSDRAVQPGLVEPRNPAAGGELKVVDAPERAVTADALGLVEPDQAFGLGIVYGVRKVHAQLAREGGVAVRPVSRRQVERLMRYAGLQGARRGRRLVTTRPDKTAARAPDLVGRDFSAARPNALWLVDFTYVSTWSGMAFTAFIHDAYSRRIVGWRTAASMPTSLPLDALEMALWTRARAGQDVAGVVHHSDAGAPGSTRRSATATGSPTPGPSPRSAPSVTATTPRP